MSLSEALLLDPYPFDVWIAARGEGNGRGSGTQSDPYDGGNPVAASINVTLTNSGNEATANTGSQNHGYGEGVASGASAAGAAFQRVWGVNRLVVEENIIELRQLYGWEFGTPTGIGVGDNNLILSSNGLPPYTHGEVVIRGNLIRVLDGAIDPSLYVQFGIFVSGAKRALISDNVIDVPQVNSIRDWNSGALDYLNNRTAAGVLIRGVNGYTLDKRTDLEAEIDDVALLSI